MEKTYNLNYRKMLHAGVKMYLIVISLFTLFINVNGQNIYWSHTFDNDTLGEFREENVGGRWNFHQIYSYDPIWREKDSSQIKVRNGSNYYWEYGIEEGRISDNPVIGAGGFHIIIDLGLSKDELYVRGDFKFAATYDYGNIHKALWGFMGGEDYAHPNSNPTCGNWGITLNDSLTKGWSSHPFCQANSYVRTYSWLYNYPNQPYCYNLQTESNYLISQWADEQWHTFTYYVKMNDLGQSNGVIAMFVDDTCRHVVDTIRFRTLTGDYSAEKLWISYFYGGDIDDAPSSDQHIGMDNIFVFDFDEEDPNNPGTITLGEVLNVDVPTYDYYGKPDTLASEDTLIYPTDDSYTRGGIYASTNYGSDEDIVVRYNNSGGNSDYDRFGHWQFDISDYPRDSIINCNFYFYLNSTVTGADYLLRTTEIGWDEETITNNNKPTVLSTLNTLTVSDSGWYAIDVTDYVKNVTQDSVSFEMWGDGSGSRLFISSKEGTHAAYLSLDISSGSGSDGKLPGKASNPSPVDGAVFSGTTLSWTSGEGATSHVIYLGTSSTPDSLTTQTEDSLIVEDFNPGVTYYWRVDEVNAYGTTTGDVWSFSTDTNDTTAPKDTLVYPTDDSYTRGGIYASTNYGSDEEIVVRYNNSYGNSDYDRFGHWQFDISEYLEDTIISCYFYFYLNSTVTSADYLLRTTEIGWDEETITNNNKPTVLSTIDNITVSDSGWYSVEVTDYVNGTTQDSVSFQMWGDGSGSLLSISSKEGINSAYLEFVLSDTSSQDTSSSTSSNLVAYWKMDEDSGGYIIDEIGGNNGLLSNGASIVEAKYDNGVSFDGTDDYVMIGNPASLQIIGSISVSVWVKPILGSYQRLVTKFGGSGYRGWSLDISSDKTARFVTATSSTAYETISSSPVYLSNNTWAHLVGVFDADNQEQRIYVDGSLASTNSIGVSSQYDPDLNIRFGMRSGGTDVFNGILDEVRIYNEALTDEEVSSLFNEMEFKRAIGYERLGTEEDLIVYPNPANDELNVEISEEMIGSKVSIFNIMGQVIVETELLTTETVIDLNGLNAGHYIIKVTGDSNFQRSFIKN